MKKYSILLLSVVFLLNACKKDDYAFDQSPDERINQTLSTFQTALAGAENGWKAFITVDSGRGGTYSLYFKFNNANRVTMVSDFDSLSAATPKESSYRLKAQQQPTLIFDTYSYLHVLADPNESVAIGINGSLNENVNGGPVGEGLRSDFEFIIDKSQVGTDTIRMNGKVYGAKLVMIKATKAESDIYLGGQFILSSTYFTEKILTYFKRLTIGSQLYDISVSASDRTITFTWVDGSGTPHIFTTGYYNIINGIALANPLINGTTIITGFTNIIYDQGTNSLTAQVAGQTTTITPIVVPLYVDKNAFNDFRKIALDAGSSWISLTGFHINGVDDALELQSTLKHGTWSYYWLQYQVESAGDVWYPLFVNPARTNADIYYAAFNRTESTPDGRVIFIDDGQTGPPNYEKLPTSGPMRQTLNVFYDVTGYYIVKVNESQYDMVGASDGKTWITWIR